ncbi:hypothetical protein B7463_g6004, partial [Scytalidium lignicola]
MAPVKMKGGIGLVCVVNQQLFMVGQYSPPKGDPATNPEEQARMLMGFIRSPDAISRLTEGLKYVRIPTDQDLVHLRSQVEFFEKQEKAKGNHYINGIPAGRVVLNDILPSLSTETGAEILKIVASYNLPPKSKYLPPSGQDDLSKRSTVWVQVDTSFSHQVWCEWCFVLDLDLASLQVYRGRAYKNADTYNHFKFLGSPHFTVPRPRFVISFDDLLKMTDEEFINDFLERDDYGHEGVGGPEEADGAADGLGGAQFGPVLGVTVTEELGAVQRLTSAEELVGAQEFILGNGYARSDEFGEAQGFTSTEGFKGASEVAATAGLAGSELLGRAQEFGGTQEYPSLARYAGYGGTEGLVEAQGLTAAEESQGDGGHLGAGLSVGNKQFEGAQGFGATEQYEAGQRYFGDAALTGGEVFEEGSEELSGSYSALLGDESEYLQNYEQFMGNNVENYQLELANLLRGNDGNKENEGENMGNGELNDEEAWRMFSTNSTEPHDDTLDGEFELVGENENI